jgi:aminomethyltransferase
MDQTATTPLKKTPLHGRHRSSGAKMMPFSGWEMPIEYSSIAEEHMAVRTRAGLFDVSHMGEIEIAGKDALAAMQRISSNDVSRLQVGQAHYSMLLTPFGTINDDLLVYRLAPAHFLLVVNAGNIQKDYAWIAGHITAAGDAVAVDVSSRYALLSLQGPRSLEILQPLIGVELGAMKYYRFAHGEVAGVRATVARTGYTGEDGFEIFVPPQSADVVWQAILRAGEGAGVIPCGLGARDTLRLEAGMRLYGSDIDETTTPLEADLAWTVGWQKDDFDKTIGAAALGEQKAAGIRWKLVGFEMIDPGIARHGYSVHVGETGAAPAGLFGKVTSGTQTPYLKKAIGMAYLPAELAVPGAQFDVDIRGRRARGRVVRMPFYKREKQGGSD